MYIIQNRGSRHPNGEESLKEAVTEKNPESCGHQETLEQTFIKLTTF